MGVLVVKRNPEEEEAMEMNPAIASRPLAVGGQVVEQRTGGQDVAPIGGNVPVPGARPVGLHPAVASRPSLDVARDRLAVGGQVVEQQMGGQDVAPGGGNVPGPGARPVGLQGAGVHA